LLNSIAPDSAVGAELREALATLAERTCNDAIRQRIGRVLEGRESLYELWRSDEMQADLAPALERARAERAAMSDEEKAVLRERVAEVRAAVLAGRDAAKREGAR
jgi:hypothetical protein